MSDIEKLERLADLHKAGVLTDAEFATQKARLLGMSAPEPASGEELAPGTGASSLDEKWHRRFAFFAIHGSPFSKRSIEAAKQLSASDRLLILFNLWAFLFGIIYFFILGIPKRGLGLAAVLAVTFFLLQRWGVWTASSSYWAIVVQSVYAGTANYYYFIKITTGRDSWDPLRDLRP